jgi:hypothetical protein
MMSSLPASWRLVKFGLVCPWREKSMNSLGKMVHCLVVFVWLL